MTGSTSSMAVGAQMGDPKLPSACRFKFQFDARAVTGLYVGGGAARARTMPSSEVEGAIWIPVPSKDAGSLTPAGDRLGGVKDETRADVPSGERRPLWLAAWSVVSSTTLVPRRQVG